MKRKYFRITTMAETRKRSLDATTSNQLSDLVSTILKDAGIENTITKGGWCLREGLSHVVTVNQEGLQPIVLHSGAPRVYQSIKCRHDDAIQNMKNPTTCFESLCRIVAGQQLAGAAAQAVWRRLLETTQPLLTPKIVLELAEQSLAENLQKPAGLSGAKARSIVDLAEKFESGVLHDTFLVTAPEQDVREALLQVRGIGPWSCDMFLLFYLERPDILPLGDLGVRKGIAKHFGLQGSGKKGSLCPKKDVDQILQAVKPYEPYHSLFSYYMWKVADTKDVYNDSKQSTKKVTPKTTATPEKLSPRKRSRK